MEVNQSDELMQKAFVPSDKGGIASMPHPDESVEKKLKNTQERSVGKVGGVEIVEKNYDDKEEE